MILVQNKFKILYTNWFDISWWRENRSKYNWSKTYDIYVCKYNIVRKMIHLGHLFLHHVVSHVFEIVCLWFVCKCNISYFVILLFMTIIHWTWTLIHLLHIEVLCVDRSSSCCYTILFVLIASFQLLMRFYLNF